MEDLTKYKEEFLRKHPDLIADMTGLGQRDIIENLDGILMVILYCFWGLNYFYSQ